MAENADFLRRRTTTGRENLLLPAPGKEREDSLPPETRDLLARRWGIPMHLHGHQETPPRFRSDSEVLLEGTRARCSDCGPRNTRYRQPSASHGNRANCAIPSVRTRKMTSQSSCGFADGTLVYSLRTVLLMGGGS